jgi:hypothetical protein
MKRPLRLAVAGLALTATVAPAQSVDADVDRLRDHLVTIAHDSMGGRSTGTRGNFLTATYVAQHFDAAGLEPAGEDGTFFQTLPFTRIALDPSSSIAAGAQMLPVGVDIVPIRERVDWSADGVEPVFAGAIADTLTWRTADVAGRLVILSAGDLSWQVAYGLVRTAANDLQNASAVALVVDDMVLGFFASRARRPSLTLDDGQPAAATRPQYVVSSATAAALLQTDLAAATVGDRGPALTGGVAYDRSAVEWPARNVVGILRGSDPALSRTYLAVSAHNDHVGTTTTPVDHDSLFAHNRVVRPMGADSRNRVANVVESVEIRAIRDSLAAHRPSRLDSVFNGADDDGSGTVALIELARALAAGERPRRSVLFVSHASEEVGLLGSEWFTDNPTVPRESILGLVDMDMVGRGPDRNMDYLEVIGSRRLSTAFGDLFDTVNGAAAEGFALNYEYDAPGHPLQYYCRVDAYSYARYGIPVISLSRGAHPDYHQLTDETQYIHFGVLARVTNLVRDFALAIGSLDERPAIDGPVAGPDARCVQ